MALIICKSMCTYALYVSLFHIRSGKTSRADTLRRWEREGKIKPRGTSGNLRRYDIADIRPDLIPRCAYGFA